MAKKKSAYNQALTSKLRHNAELAIKKPGVTDDYSGKSPNELLQELQVHQIELEMQNDELKLANEELELQQLKFSRVYNLAPLGYFIINNAGVIEEVNHAGKILFGDGKNELAGRTFAQLVLVEHRARYYAFYHQMLASLTRQTTDITLRSLQGTEFNAQLQGIAVKSGFGGHPQYYIAVTDISERVNADRSLAETKERLEMALEASSAGTWQLDPDTMQIRLDESNRQISALLQTGFNGDYNNFISLVHPDDRETVDQHFRTCINHEKSVDVVCRLSNGGNKLRYVSIRGHAVIWANRPKRWVGTIMDVTEKMVTEDESLKLKQEQQKAIAAATLNAEENERRRISDSLHDSVSQLLYGIKIKMGLLNANGPSTKEIADIHELLDTAIQETRNISFELAPSILTDFGLPATVQELAKRLSTPKMHIDTRFINLSKRLHQPLELSVFRIIQELVNNSMKHSGASLIKIEIKKNKFLHIQVKDNGCGYDPYQQERSVVGSGLRSIKNRLELYNGKMQIDSVPGKGTTINITLNYEPSL